MGKGAPDTNPVGTKSGGWVKLQDGYWHTEAAATTVNVRKLVANTATTKTTETAATTTTAPAATTTIAPPTKKK